MRVSVVLCTHTMERYDDCRAAAESVLAQTYDDVELVLVSMVTKKCTNSTTLTTATGTLS